MPSAIGQVFTQIPSIKLKLSFAQLYVVQFLFPFSKLFNFCAFFPFSCYCLPNFPICNLFSTEAVAKIGGDDPLFLFAQLFYFPVAFFFFFFIFAQFSSLQPMFNRRLLRRWEGTTRAVPTPALDSLLSWEPVSLPQYELEATVHTPVPDNYLRPQFTHRSPITFSTGEGRRDNKNSVMRLIEGAV